MIDISKRDTIKLRNEAVTVIGIGVSGIAAANLAHHLGAKVFISDLKHHEIIREKLRRLQSEKIEYETGGHSDRIYESGLWIISPGVPQDAAVILEAQKRNIPIVSEVEFASWFTDAPILAVTGSNGKTTTVHALTAMCQSREIQGALAGNVGIPFSEKVLEELVTPAQKRVYILEISSFQMEFIRHFKPFISIFLNIAPDHLDRYRNMDDYISAKLNMIRNQDSGDFIIFNADDSILASCFDTATATKIPFSLSTWEGTKFGVNKIKIYDEEHAMLVKLNEIALPGKHNLANLLAAATAAKLLGISNRKISSVMKSFSGVAHRLERVADIDQVTFINDSKATNVDAVKVALNSFTQPIILILGGLDKGGDFKQLLPHLYHVKTVIVYGQAQQKIVSALADAVRLHRVSGLNQAVTISKRLASPGDFVLLSPGCASFDQFANYEERGEKFKVWVSHQESVR